MSPGTCTGVAPKVRLTIILLLLLYYCYYYTIVTKVNKVHSPRYKGIQGEQKFRTIHF
jgi:hypothetical protein